MHQFLEFSAEVRDARNQQKPILALESTVITHGLPKPINYELALQLETIARDNGATPATIAVMNGKIKIGLSSDELLQLANDTNVMKASRRDISYVMSKKMSAGTTVAAALFAASAADIKVFATGGIGGVHRGDAQDISADLIELSRTPLAVICAGAKAILDLPKTLEFLETFSIPIFGYQTETLPAFYSRSSNHLLPAKANDVDELATFIKMHWLLGNHSGVLVTNPIPTQYEIPAHEIEPFIQNALQEAYVKDISGKNLTPFLLNEIAQITQGKSVQTNIELLKNNVMLGAKLASALM